MRIRGFTQDAEHTLGAAKEEARDLSHCWVGTEHLLLGIASLLSDRADGSLRLRRALTGVTSEAIRTPVLKTVSAISTNSSDKTFDDGEAPLLTPQVRQVLVRASQLALNFKNDLVGSEHLLLGILYERDGFEAQVLRELNVTYETLYELVAGMSDLPPVEEVSSLPSVAPAASFAPYLVTERVTPGAAHVLEIARQQAENEDSKDRAVGTHDYLAALMIEGAISPDEGLAGKVLRSFGLTYGAIKARIDELGVQGTSDATDWSTAPPPQDDN